MGEKMRIYVGGLGPNVREDDLRKTFSSPQLGTVESVEIIRSKGRGFAYLEFVPASDKGLAKLFSSYNGCMWKGGRLKLEKAREHYMHRLQREWTEDAELEAKLSSQNVHADESVPVLQKPKKDQDFGKLQIKLYFPKLRKIKPIPLKGTGKHKYSFQRVEIPPLPIHFCDCEEHCGPPEPAKRNCNNDHEAETYGVNENELNMMKSVLTKFLAKEECPDKVSNEFELAEETRADNRHIDESEEDQVSDEDNLVINVVGRSSKRASLFEDWGQKTIAANQNVQDISNRPIPEMRGGKKENLHPDKKRKQQSVPENYSNDKANTNKKVRMRGPHDSTDNPVVTNTRQTEKGSGSNVASSHKSAWKDLVREKESTTFHISDILMDHNPEEAAKSRSEHLAAELCSNDNEAQEDQSSEDEELEKLSESTNLSASENDTQEDQSSEDEGLEKLSESDKLSASENDTQEDQSSEDEGLEKPSESTELSASENDTQEDQSSEDDESEKLSESSKLRASENDTQEEESSQEKETEKLSESTKSNASEHKYARGEAWLQKSSWLQLIADANKSAFSISQILPGVTYEKQELPQFDGNRFSNSRIGEQHTSVHKDQNSALEDMGEPQGRAEKDIIHATPGDSTVDVLPPSDSKQTIAKEDVGTQGTNLVPNNRDVGDIVISETCPFMKSAASMKEWTKTKAALSGSLKRKGKGKELAQD